MLRIILGILKLIGIVLGVLFCLLLCILLLVLFVPVRYRGKIQKKAEEMQAELHLNWLFHLISLDFAMDLKGQQMKWGMRICGISLTTLRNFFHTLRKQEKQEKSREKADQVTKASPEPISKARTQDEMPVSSELAKSTESKRVSDSSTPKTPNVQSEQKSPPKGQLRALVSSIRRIWNHFLESGAQIQDVQAKLAYYMDLIRKYEAVQTVKDAFHIIFVHLRHYFPRTLKGYVKFGLSDPADTGKLTGLFYLMRPSSAALFEVEPVFDQVIFETEATFYGRIRSCHAIVLLIRLLLNRKLIRLIKKIRALCAGK